MSGGSAGGEADPGVRRPSSWTSDARDVGGSSFRACAASCPGVRWVRAEGIHLTLRFLGYARRDGLDALGAAASRAAERCPAGTAAPGSGLFPERGRARVLWLGPSARRRPAAAAGLRAGGGGGGVRAGDAGRSRRTSRSAAGASLRRGRRCPPGDLGRTASDQLVLYRSQPGTGLRLHAARALPARAARRRRWAETRDHMSLGPVAAVAARVAYLLGSIPFSYLVARRPGHGRPARGKRQRGGHERHAQRGHARPGSPPSRSTS